MNIGADRAALGQLRRANQGGGGGGGGGNESVLAELAAAVAHKRAAQWQMRIEERRHSTRANSRDMDTKEEQRQTKGTRPARTQLPKLELASTCCLQAKAAAVIVCVRVCVCLCLCAYLRQLVAR